ncbi:hypothetical protein PN497_08815 [Sphaerospermopsis kisseleviana CS-549]|uniref:Uncharacterized protein n=1 Tax=Sphaerospermopsis kisseleviana CS-549 TaxID=3021783 RepID=A0ABT4ZRQ6_9CYAN|nr:hypothetical protein [Sphaerospermopsis kisseleviana]MDB9441458.1 hypothetical protein [Sphaerospermopsis kisseleviana CS-549]
MQVHTMALVSKYPITVPNTNITRETEERSLFYHFYHQLNRTYEITENFVLA